MGNLAFAHHKCAFHYLSTWGLFLVDVHKIRLRFHTCKTCQYLLMVGSISIYNRTCASPLRCPQCLRLFGCTSWQSLCGRGRGQWSMPHSSQLWQVNMGKHSTKVWVSTRTYTRCMKWYASRFAHTLRLNMT